MYIRQLALASLCAGMLITGCSSFGDLREVSGTIEHLGNQHFRSGNAVYYIKLKDDPADYTCWTDRSVACTYLHEGQHVSMKVGFDRDHHNQNGVNTISID